jgi:mannose/fructose/N-acetylgalactosamine-specific phosphotransferase system component IIC
VNYAALATIALGGLAVVEATPVAQALLSQPLVTASVLGLLWGQWELALRIGIVLQVLAASTLPVGARTPEDYAAGGVVGTGVGLAIATRSSFLLLDDAAAVAGVLAGLVAAIVGVPLIRWQRRRNEGLARWCEARLRAGDTGALGAAQGAGVVLAFGVGVGYSAVCLALGVGLLGPLVEAQSLRLARAWALAQPLWIGLGLAYLLQAFVQRRLTRAAAFAAALLGAWLVLMTTGR